MGNFLLAFKGSDSVNLNTQFGLEAGKEINYVLVGPGSNSGAGGEIRFGSFIVPSDYILLFQGGNASGSIGQNVTMLINNIPYDVASSCVNSGLGGPSGNGCLSSGYSNYACGGGGFYPYWDKWGGAGVDYGSTPPPKFKFNLEGSFCPTFNATRGLSSNNNSYNPQDGAGYGNGMAPGGNRQNMPGCIFCFWDDE